MRQKVNGKLFAFTTIPRRFWHSSYMQQKKSSPIYMRAPSRQLLVGYVACVRDVQIARQRIRAGSVWLEFSSRVKTFRATRFGSARLDSTRKKLGSFQWWPLPPTCTGRQRRVGWSSRFWAARLWLFVVFEWTRFLSAIRPTDSYPRQTHFLKMRKSVQKVVGRF